MANPITRIIISAVDRTKAAFNAVAGGLRKVGDEAEKSNTRLNRVGSEISGLFGKIGLSFAALYNVRQLGGLLDDFSNLQARLKLVSRSTEEYNQANKDLVRIAETSKTPISETATLYTRIAASVKDLDVSQSSVADTTEAVALSLRISGASAQESSAAMLQFSQAIASGVLRGEEFNSMAEAAPRVLQALAKSLKVPVGELREMAKEGKLTRDVLLNGLLQQLPELRREAESLPGTFGSAFTKLKNQLFLVAGEFDKTTVVTKSFSESLGAVGKVGIEALAVVAANVLFVFKGIGREIGGIAAQMTALATGDFKAFKIIGDAMKEDAAEARRVLDEFERKILKGDTSLNEARQENSAETRDVIIRDRAAEVEANKKSTTEQISDAQRLQSALQTAFSQSIKAETDYMRQAKKLRAEANATEAVSDDPEAQASARLGAIIALMKLQREASNASLEDVQDQAEAVRALAGGLADAALKSDLMKQASLAEAAALEKAGAEEGARAASQAELLRATEAQAATLKQALDGIGKEVSVDIKPGAQMEKTKQDLTEIVHLLDLIKQAGPINVNAAAPAGASADALRTAARQYGRRN